MPAAVLDEELERQLNVCPSCQQHMPWPTRARLAALLDPASSVEADVDLTSSDPSGFSDSKKYKDRVRSTQKSTAERGGVVS